MARIKVGVTAHRRHKKILKLAKGYRGSKHLLFKKANETVMKALSYARRDRRAKKREFRRLWIARINAAPRANGMSYSRRDGKNANSAIIVAVTPADYGSDHPLAGIEFQRGLEQRAYELCDGKLPVQRYGDFREKVTGEHPAETDGVQRSGPEALEPQCKGAYEWADLTGILPAECNRAFVELSLIHI